ncbi:hypothetical protein BU15DRAFT_54426 [Melanogaster broomeanus]|nr:hypothetical protein BU15DRAFT_54426 [Melanogaster broomeanus]
MLHSYLKGAKLRAWVSRPDCPAAIRECKILLDRAYQSQETSEKPNADGIILPNVTGNPRATVLPDDLQQLIGQCRGVLRANVKHSAGVFYSRSSMHLGNSLIFFYSRGNRSLPPVPGSIKYIYQDGESFLFAVQRQRPLSEKSKVTDAFSAYPHFPAKVYSSDLEDTLESVQCSWVSSHYARWALFPGAVVVLSLCKVRFSTSLFVTDVTRIYAGLIFVFLWDIVHLAYSVIYPFTPPQCCLGRPGGCA